MSGRTNGPAQPEPTSYSGVPSCPGEGERAGTGGAPGVTGDSIEIDIDADDFGETPKVIVDRDALAAPGPGERRPAGTGGADGAPHRGSATGADGDGGDVPTTGLAIPVPDDTPVSGGTVELGTRELVAVEVAELEQTGRDVAPAERPRDAGLSAALRRQLALLPRIGSDDKLLELARGQGAAHNLCADELRLLSATAYVTLARRALLRCSDVKGELGERIASLLRQVEPGRIDRST